MAWSPLTMGLISGKFDEAGFPVISRSSFKVSRRVVARPRLGPPHLAAWRDLSLSLSLVAEQTFILQLD